MQNRKVDERYLKSFEVLSVLKGNLDPLTWYQDEVAYNNLAINRKIFITLVDEHPEATTDPAILKAQQL